MKIELVTMIRRLGNKLPVTRQQCVKVNFALKRSLLTKKGNFHKIFPQRRKLKIFNTGEDAGLGVVVPISLEVRQGIQSGAVGVQQLNKSPNQSSYILLLQFQNAEENIYFLHSTYLAPMGSSRPYRPPRSPPGTGTPPRDATLSTRSWHRMTH